MSAANDDMPSPLLVRMRIAAAYAACGMLIIPLVVSLVYLAPVVGWVLCQKRYGHIARMLGIVILGLVMVTPSVLGALSWWYYTGYRYGLSIHTSVLSAEIHRYYKEHGNLPETLEEISRQGIYAQAYRFPEDGDGLPPLYLPVSNWDGRTPVIVAITAKSQRYPMGDRGYVILGDWATAHFASEEDLQWILRADSVVRDKLGDQRNWGAVTWR